MEVIVNDESVNSYGFRVLTEGIDLSAFLKNPVMLYDHTRKSYQNDKDIILPIGKWNNLKKVNGQLIAEPEFDVEDTFAKEISRKFDKGYLNAASLGFPALEAIELSYEPEDMLPGQTGPTVKRSLLLEISITDIPGNYNCVKMGYSGSTITLNGKNDPTELTNFFNSNKTQPTMKKVIAALNGSKLVTLSEASNEELVAEAVITLSNQLGAKDQSLALKDAEIVRLTTELTTAKNASLVEKATALVEGALSAKKITAAQKENFVKLSSQSEEGYTTVKAMLDSMQGYQSVIPGLKSGVEIPASKEDQVKMYDLHAKEGTLKTLGEDNIKALFKTKYGKEIQDSTLKALCAK